MGGPIPIVGGSVANVPVADPAGDGPVAGGLKQGLKLDAGHGNGNKNILHIIAICNMLCNIFCRLLLGQNVATVTTYTNNLLVLLQ